jgi:hypothetical protein
MQVIADLAAVLTGSVLVTAAPGGFKRGKQYDYYR